MEKTTFRHSSKYKKVSFVALPKNQFILSTVVKVSSMALSESFMHTTVRKFYAYHCHSGFFNTFTYPYFLIPCNEVAVLGQICNITIVIWVNDLAYIVQLLYLPMAKIGPINVNPKRQHIWHSLGLFCTSWAAFYSKHLVTLVVLKSQFFSKVNKHFTSLSRCTPSCCRLPVLFRKIIITTKLQFGKN